MSAECAVCYVADVNFLLPSIVSAASLRRFVPPYKADIFIFTVGMDSARAEDVDRFLMPQGIRVVAMDDRAFTGIDKERLTRTYTPMAMFGRLFMDELLPPSCRHIVYLDGDTWVERDPSALIDAAVPDGYFAAAEDTIFFRQKSGLGATARGIRRYFGQLGLNPKNGYFNSGVFATSRATWKTIAREAYDYYVANAAICEHSPDQSALNAIMGDRRLRLSSRWNFQTQFRFWGVERYLAPVIYHFNRYPKPWMGVCPPWEDIYPRYEAAVAPFAGLGLPLKKLGADEMRKANASARKAYAYLRLPLVSRLALAGMGYRAVEQTAWL